MLGTPKVQGIHGAKIALTAYGAATQKAAAEKACFEGCRAQSRQARRCDCGTRHG
jgi:hypothetical protein